MDLTCEASESAVVDLTNNDSVLVTVHTHSHTACLSIKLTSYICSAAANDDDDGGGGGPAGG